MDVASTSALTGLMRQLKTEAVVHFAAFIAVGESMAEPERYFVKQRNGFAIASIRHARSRVKHLVFSSTARRVRQSARGSDSRKPSPFNR